MPSPKVSLALLLLIGSAAFSQTLPEPSPQRGTSVHGAISVTAIDLDASATKEGQPVNDLRAEEVVLKIDGNPVPLDYFTPVFAGRLTGPAHPGMGAGASGLVARHFLLVIDEDHLVPQDRGRAFDAARAFFARLDPSDRFAVVVLQSARLRSLVPFGMRIDVAGKALDDQQRNKYSFGLLGQQMFAAPMVREKERNAFKQLQRAVQSLGAYPGRKEMILISRGLNRYEGTGGRASHASLDRELNDLVSQANRSRVTIHTLGVSGLEAEPGFC
jgi:VWFA-related protein